MKYTKVTVTMEGGLFDAPMEFDLDDDPTLEEDLEMPTIEMGGQDKMPLMLLLLLLLQRISSSSIS